MRSTRDEATPVLLVLLLSEPALKLVYTATKITIILITTFSGTKMHFPKSSQFERGGVQGSNLQERSHLQSRDRTPLDACIASKVKSEGYAPRGVLNQLFKAT